MTSISSTPCPRILPDGSVCGSLERRPRGNCAACHRRAAAAYRKRKAEAPGSHTEAEWLSLAATFTHCPGCNRPWDEVERPNGQRNPFTKGHIIALTEGGSDCIENLRPECARCNYGGAGVGFSARRKLDFCGRREFGACSTYRCFLGEPRTLLSPLRSK